MNTGGEAADQVIKMGLNGAEVALRITGAAAKEVATMLYAILKDNKKSKGRTRLENLIKTGRPLTIFTVKASDYDHKHNKHRYRHHREAFLRRRFPFLNDILFHPQTQHTIRKCSHAYTCSCSTGDSRYRRLHIGCPS